MSFAFEKLFFRLASVFFLALCVTVCGTVLQAQTRRSSTAKNAKQTSKDKKAVADKKDPKKDRTDSKKEKADSKKDKADSKSAKADKKEKSKKPTKAELAAQAELRRKEEARRREAAEAALAERRRREQAAREARERQIAFERGLRTETIANIAKDNTDGEDLEIRRAAVSALGTHAGTVVVMEAQTGKVLTIVNQDWAIRKGFKPCSTIKLVTGVAGLSENAIDEDGSIHSRRFPMALDDALAHSNNSYFQAVGSNLGNNRMLSYAKALGLGEQTGINAENESPGRLPYGNNNARIYSHGDDFEVTPLQLAVMVSAISNGGKKVVPQIPRMRSEKTDFQGVLRGEVNLPKNKLEGVLPGMVGAVNYGTARRSGATEFNAAGKTGSCISQGSWLGLFASVAPVVNPKYSVVVITRGQSERGKYASEIAGKIYRSLSTRFRENGGAQDLVAKLPVQLKPQPKVNAKTSALVDNDEGEDSDEGDVNATKIKQEIAKRPNPKKGGDDISEITAGNQTAAPKTSTQQAQKNPNIFSPVIIQVNKDEITKEKEFSRPRVVRMNNK